MINRLLIRIKTVQLVYACVESGNPRINHDDEFMASLEASHMLYNYLLALIVKVTDYRRAQLIQARSKYLATAEELNPNTRFVDNQIARFISERSEVLDFCDKHSLTSDFDTELYRSIFEEIEKSEAYQNYMNQPATPSFDDDRKLWSDILHNIFPVNAKLDEVLEERSIYWNDDLTTVLQFVVKAVNKIKPDTEMLEVEPTFRSDADREFAMTLFHKATDEAADHVRAINSVASNWESSRMATMDKVIMICALTEIKNFADIPLNVTMNEYIELAHHYCSPKSGQFINGVVDKIVRQWRAEKKIFK